MTTGSLAVVVEFAILVDVETMQADAEVKHCAPHLCQAIPGWNMVEDSDNSTEKGMQKKKGFHIYKSWPGQILRLTLGWKT